MNTDLQQKLAAPFSMDVIKFRLGSVSRANSRGMALTYAESRAYQERLDAIFGLDGWSIELSPLHDKATKARLVVQVDGKSVVREATGTDTDLMSAESRAFKRACSALGLGRYLYESPTIWATAQQKGKNWVLTSDGEQFAANAFAQWCAQRYPGWTASTTQNTQTQPPPPQQQQQQQFPTQSAGQPQGQKPPPPKPQVGNPQGVQGTQPPPTAASASQTTTGNSDGRPDWPNPEAAKKWAEDNGYCQNGFEAQASWVKQVAIAWPNVNILEVDQLDVVYDAYYARQIEKGNS